MKTKRRHRSNKRTRNASSLISNIRISIENILAAGGRSGQSEFLDPTIEPANGRGKKQNGDTFGRNISVC